MKNDINNPIGFDNETILTRAFKSYQKRTKTLEEFLKILRENPDLLYCKNSDGKDIETLTNGVTKRTSNDGEMWGDDYAAIKDVIKGIEKKDLVLTVTNSHFFDGDQRNDLHIKIKEIGASGDSKGLAGIIKSHPDYLLERDRKDNTPLEMYLSFSKLDPEIIQIFINAFEDLLNSTNEAIETEDLLGQFNQATDKMSELTEESTELVAEPVDDGADEGAKIAFLIEYYMKKDWDTNTVTLAGSDLLGTLYDHYHTDSE